MKCEIDVVLRVADYNSKVYIYIVNWIEITVVRVTLCVCFLLVAAALLINKQKFIYFKFSEDNYPKV